MTDDLPAGIDSTDPEVRSRAIRDVRRRGLTAAVPSILDALTDDDPRVRAEGVLTLKRFISDGHLPAEATGEEQLARALTTRLTDDVPRVAQGAIDAVIALDDVALESLIDLLHSDDRTTRTAAVAALSKIDSEHVGQRLVAEFRATKDPVTRTALVGATYRCSPGSLVTVVTEALDSSEERERRSAVGALRALSHADDALLRRLTDLCRGDDPVDPVVVRALGRLTDDRTSEPLDVLTSRLTDGPDNLAVAAAVALGSLDDVAAITPLLDAVDERGGRVARAAAASISQIGDESDESFGSEQTRQLIDVLVDADDPAVIGSLLRAASEAGCDEVILAGEPPLGYALAAAYRAASTDARRECGYILALTGTEAAVGALCDALEDSDPETRAEAADALGAVGLDVDELTATFDEGSQVYATLDRLGGTPPARAIDPLRERLSDTDARVRRDAAATLGDLEAHDALEAVVGRLRNDPDPDVRRAAALAVSKIGGENAVDALIVAGTHDVSPAVRSRVALALSNPALSAADDAAVLLDDDDVSVRTEAASALSYANDDRVIEPLCTVLKFDPDPAVRRSAVKSLGEIAPGAVGDVLRQAARNDSDRRVRSAAADARRHLRWRTSGTYRLARLCMVAIRSIWSARPRFDPDERPETRWGWFLAFARWFGDLVISIAGWVVIALVVLVLGAIGVAIVQSALGL